MRVLDALIDDRHGQRRIARGEFPRLLHVDIRSGARRFGKYPIAVVAVVPLVLVAGVVETSGGGARRRRTAPVGTGPVVRSQLQFGVELHEAHLRNGGEPPCRCVQIDFLVERHDIPFMQSRRAGALFGDRIAGKYAAQRSDAQLCEDVVHGRYPGARRRRTRNGRRSRTDRRSGGLFDVPDGIAVEIDQQFAPRGIRGSIDDLAHGGRRRLLAAALFHRVRGTARKEQQREQ